MLAFCLARKQDNDNGANDDNDCEDDFNDDETYRQT